MLRCVHLQPTVILRVVGIRVTVMLLKDGGPCKVSVNSAGGSQAIATDQQLCPVNIIAVWNLLFPILSCCWSVGCRVQRYKS